MSRAAVMALVLFVPLSLVTRQALAQPQTVVESIDVTIIEVDVAVVDSTGKPVRGLTREDFELRVGGRKREISNFYAVQPSPAEMGNAFESSGKIPAPAAPHRNYLVLFIDDLHLQQGEKKRALDALRTFIAKHVRPGTAAMLVVSNGDLRVRQRFTEEPAPLIRAIEALEGEPAHANEYESERRELIRRIDEEGPITILIYRQQMITMAERQKSLTLQTMAALREVLHSAAGLHGRRILVYVSDGLPMQPGLEILHHYKPDVHVGVGTSAIANRAMENFNELEAMSTSLARDFQRLASDAAEAGVQFFAIDASGTRGFAGSGPEAKMDAGLDWSLIRSNLHAPIQLLAEETGGRAIIDQNDFDAAFSELAEHLSTYYSLGFASDGSKQSANVQVRMRSPGLTVRAAKRAREHTYREQIENGVRARLYARDEENPLRAEVSVKNAGNRSELVVAVRVPIDVLSALPSGEDALAAFDIYLAMIDENMRESPLRVIRHVLRPGESPFAVQHIYVRAPPGRYAVSLAVLDTFSWQTSYFQRDVELPVH